MNVLVEVLSRDALSRLKRFLTCMCFIQVLRFFEMAEFPKPRTRLGNVCGWGD